jgi:hypothetical protein
MKIDEKDIELIEKYFDGTLNKEEKSVFDKKLSENSEFAELVKLRSTLPEIWKDTAKYESIKKEIQGALILEEKESKFFTIKRIYYAVAAGILLLVGTFVIFFLINNNKNLSDQAAKNKSVREDSLSIMQQIEQPSKAKKEIYKDIKSEDIGLISPVEGMVFHYHDTIIFKWVNKNDTTTHLTLISNYDNKTVEIIAVLPGVEMVSVKASELKPGEYYWMLSDRKIKRFFSVIK